MSVDEKLLRSCLLSVRESLEICEEELPPEVWSVIRGYFFGTYTEVMEITEADQESTTPNEMDGFNLDQFLVALKNFTESFTDFYEGGLEARPDEFPAEMSYQDWFKQFRAYDYE